MFKNTISCIPIAPPPPLWDSRPRHSPLSL
jgi:hypothetical protein